MTQVRPSAGRLSRQFLRRRTDTEPDRRWRAGLLRDKRCSSLLLGDRWHGRGLEVGIVVPGASGTSTLGRESGWEEGIDAGGLRLKGLRLEAAGVAETGGLRLHRHAGCERVRTRGGIREGRAELVAHLRALAELALEACRLGLHEACLLRHQRTLVAELAGEPSLLRLHETVGLVLHGHLLLLELLHTLLVLKFL